MFKYSCFISYRHLEDKQTPKFMEQFITALEAELTPLLGKNIYVDDHRMRGGMYIEGTIATELCRSACMVMIYCPQYFNDEHLYCTREFLSMRALEAVRLNLQREGSRTNTLIIPVIYRGSADFPMQKIGQPFYYNFEQFTLWGREILKNRQLHPQVRKLAEDIKRIVRSFDSVQPSVCNGCDSHRLPSEQEARDWLKNKSNDHYHFPFRD